MTSPVVIQPAWALFLIKYTDVLITIGLVYFSLFFTMVAATILSPALRSKSLTLPGFRAIISPQSLPAASAQPL